jgi:ribokinase
MNPLSRRPTIREVARLAQVSTATVSNVLTGRVPAREQTRLAVERAVAELGYRPNRSAQSLIARRTLRRSVVASSAPRLSCVGYLSVDYTARVGTLPRRDDRITAQSIEKSVGGPAANVAVMAAGLGPPFAVECELITALGDDADSDWALEELAARQVTGVGMPRYPDGRLSRCIVVVDAEGSRMIVNEPIALEVADVRRSLAAADQRGRRHCIHVEGYQLAGLAPALPFWRQQSALLSLQTTGLPAAWRRPETLGAVLQHFDLVFLNREVARALLGQRRPHPDMIEAVAAFVAERTAATVLLTLGADGAAVLEPGSPPRTVPALPVRPVDTTGAGDCFAGIFLAAWLNGASPLRAARLAAAGASLSVEAEGAQGLHLDAATLLRVAGEEPAAAQQSQSVL